ncbi:hypothetical protein Godav_000863, partial [Gossypium davidsonii]|nr:hypothetical protein [Gossypium davidsonii]
MMRWLWLLAKIGCFARTFADINLDDGNQDSVPIDYNTKEIEE